MHQSALPVTSTSAVFRMRNPDGATVGYAYAQSAFAGLVIRWLLLPGYLPPPLRDIDAENAGAELNCRSVSEWRELVSSWWAPGAVYAWSVGRADPLHQIYFADHPAIVLVEGVERGVVIGTALEPFSQQKGAHPVAGAPPPTGAARKNREHWYLTSGLDGSPMRSVQLRKSDAISSLADLQRWLSERSSMHYTLDSFYYDSIPNDS